ncbi:MAG: hypothetical protein IIC60_07595 [Proteobacteria bacterium]|nr:hypothetical protein [Pseudomonadota bacterium]
MILTKLKICWPPLSVLIGLGIIAVPVLGQQSTAEGPWFGIDLPPALISHVSPVTIGKRGPAPAVVPAGEETYRELEGRRLAYDLDRIVDFSKQSRLNRELGGDQLWGRVSGF